MKHFVLSATLLAGALLATVPALAQTASPTVYGIQIEEFERRWGDEDERVNVWNADAFIGDDDLRFRWLSEGEYDDVSNRFEGLENRLVAQVPISDFFDAKAGIRFDTPNGPDRTYAVLGVTGLAPQWFEIDADLFFSEKSDLSARLDAEYELLITNRLILTPSLDMTFAFSDDEEIEVRRGFSKMEAGMRLGYDLIDRAFSPYVGMAYERKLGNTADIAREENKGIDAWFGVVGLKMVF